MEPVATLPPHLAATTTGLPAATVAGSYRLPPRVITAGSMPAEMVVMPPTTVTSTAAPITSSPVYLAPQVTTYTTGVNVPYAVSHTLGVTDPLAVSTPALPPGTPPLSVPRGGFKFYGPNEYPGIEEPPVSSEAEPLLQTGPPPFIQEPLQDLRSTTVLPDAFGGAPPAPSPPSPPGTAHFTEADRYEALASVREQHVEQLAQQPVTTQNLEAQIQELLEGQRALKYELDEVKAQCRANYDELEVLRREAQAGHMQQAPPPQYYDPAAAAPRGYDYQQAGPADGAPMPMEGPPPMTTMSEADRPLMPPPPAMQTQSSVASGPARPPNNLGYGESTLMDTVSRMGDHARNLHGHAMSRLSMKGSGGSMNSSGGSSGRPKLFGRC